MSPYFTKYGYSRRYHEDFVAAQEEARAAGVGIWDPEKLHYDDYDARLQWWNARGDFIAEFEADANGRDEFIALTNWDALRRLEESEDEEVVVLATVGSVYRGDRVSKVMLSRRLGADFPLVFFDEHVLEKSRIEEYAGEYVRVSGVVARYQNPKKKRDELQIIVNVASQVRVPDYVPPGNGAPTAAEAAETPASPEATDPDVTREPRRNPTWSLQRPLTKSSSNPRRRPRPLPLEPPREPWKKTAPTGVDLMAGNDRLLPLRAGLLFGSAALLALSCKGGNSDDEGQCAAGLLPGDLVISEVMPNPPGSDDQTEWFEIYNAGSSAVDLEGVTLVSAKEDGTSPKEHELTSITIEPGRYLVVGNMIDEVRPDHVDYGYGNDLGDMRNSTGELSIRCGDALIDRILYLDPSDGASRGFDGSQAPDAVANDDLAAWCDASTEYEPGALGTPGSANTPCAGGQDTCLDGDESRDVVAPGAGDLIITEYMPNPSAVGDTEGEWFEVFATADVDLNGLELGKEVGDVEDTIAAAECISVSAGDYIVFARGDDAAVNGGLPQVDHLFGFALSNSGSGMFIGHGGELLDEVSWTSSNDGAATSLHPDRFDELENDDEAAWCVATDAYGDGDFGTPGGPNPECDVPPPDGMCEENGELREVVSPVEGDIVITELMPDPSAAPDADGEWFEILVTANVDLNGLELGRDVGDPDLTLEPTECLSMTAGSYVVFAKSDDMGLNGGLPQVDHTFSFSLTNSRRHAVCGHRGRRARRGELDGCVRRCLGQPRSGLTRPHRERRRGQLGATASTPTGRGISALRGPRIRFATEAAATACATTATWIGPSSSHSSGT